MKFTYTGQYSNVAEFGLVYYGARWYDNALSRFAQADTILPNPGDPRAWDRFAYVLNNPLKYIDPTGHRNCEEDGYNCWPSNTGGGTSSSSGGNAPSTPSGPPLTGQGKAWGGKQLYELYTWVWGEASGWWWDVFGADGAFDIRDFAGLLLYYEGSTFSDAYFREGAVRAFYGWSSSVYKDLAGTTAAALNWLASMGSGKSRYFNILGGMSVGSQFEQRYQTREATILASQFRNPPLEWKSGWSFGSPYH